MNIELVGKDLPISDMLRERIKTKLTKIETRIGQKLFFRVKLQAEQHSSFSCAIHFTGGGREFNATGSGADLLGAADAGIAKIERQLSKR